LKKILENLFIGDDADCSITVSDVAVIHACKTCHQKGVDYRGNLSSNHSNYLIFEEGNHLFLNLVDMKRELLDKYTHPIMKSAFVFIRTRITNQKVLIHCNQGLSRSPSIGLIYLARTKNISNNSYNDAKEEFLKIYSAYSPGAGIELYLQSHWGNILEL